MRGRAWILCLWPGLPRLWLYGNLPALLWAAAFAGLLQVALLTGFAWPELLPSAVRTLLWLGVTSVWLVSAVVSCSKLPYTTQIRHSVSADALFREAQTEYLKGNWFQAEALLQRVLQYDVDDVEARLALTSLYRRVRRVAEAEDQLRQLQRFSVSERWQPEIQREQQFLCRLASREDDSTSAPVSVRPPERVGTAEAA